VKWITETARLRSRAFHVAMWHRNVTHLLSQVCDVYQCGHPIFLLTAVLADCSPSNWGDHVSLESSGGCCVVLVVRWVRLIGFVALMGLWLMPLTAMGRDLDGRYANSPLKPWFDQLKSQNGACCSMPTATSSKTPTGK